MNLFIDTNVFLSFYHLTNDDLEELHKLVVLIEKNEVTLWLPEQVVDEYRRNREIKISDALKKLKDQKLKPSFPAFCKDYPQYSDLRGKLKECDKLLSDLVGAINNDIEKGSLKADEVIAELFSKATRIDTSSEILTNARNRMEVGSPPGKNKSFGDAINWEGLLETVPEGEDIYLVADDKDYFSILDENKPKEYLTLEWEDKKTSMLFGYRRLSMFFKEHYPDIKLASELERELQVQALVNSGAFTVTHSAISKLSKHTGFNKAHSEALFSALLQNNQINWILDDEDVKEFYLSLYEQHKGKIDSELEEKVLVEFKQSKILEETTEEADIPF